WVRRCSDFFFQAEDGIRDFHVTGVQTCGLPIFYGDLYPMADATALRELKPWLSTRIIGQETLIDRLLIALLADGHLLVEGAPGRSEERRVGKGCRGRGAPRHYGRSGGRRSSDCL